MVGECRNPKLTSSLESMSGYLKRSMISGSSLSPKEKERKSLVVSGSDVYPRDVLLHLLHLPPVHRVTHARAQRVALVPSRKHSTPTP